MFKKNIKQLFEGGPFGFVTFLVGVVLLLVGLSWLVDSSTSTQMLSHSEFIKAVDDEKVEFVKVAGDNVFGKFTDGGRFEGTVHLTDAAWDNLKNKNINVVISGAKQAYDPWLIAGFIIFTLIIISLWMYFRKSKGSGGGMSSIFSFGKSRFKKVAPGELKTGFDNVAGASQAKDALTDIIEFLKNPEKFKKLGARIPKGVLLSGEPGNGKTLLARAVAGEAGCTFLSITGSDFIEVFVGVGAARIRDLFAQARKAAPCILFIDEIDAIGRSRGVGVGGGSDEREQTLNQLLTEMDGFDQYEMPIVVLAASNIPEVLDRALLRPGRFDRVVYVPYPDFDARVELLSIHAKHKSFAEDVKIEEIASHTQGLSGADMENLVNIASLNASQKGRESLTADDFKSAYKKVMESKRDIQRAANDKAKEFLPQQVKTRFENVAGLEDAKEDLREIVDFLKEPKKYLDMGARIPRGVLMSGDPGNGKTLLARAVAGESGVPYFYASGSQFIQKYVGVGAERIRELFTQARRNAPAIIFIDELDSIGKRDTSGDGGNREYNQTINQLLTEMDGFVEEEIPVVVIAATNIKDAIDDALKRPGRFDRQVHIPYPNLRARKKILQVHARGKKFDNTVDLDTVAKGTPGFSGAALEGLLNESAILAVAHKHETISMSDIEEAQDRLMIGKKNVGIVRTEDELKKTAYHEAGHALTSMIQKEYPFSFHKVTILSRGGTLGVSHSLPQDDMTGFSKKHLEAKIVVCMAGRVAEELVFDDIHTGAIADFQSATSVARDMVVKYGMGDTTGVVSYIEHRNISTQTAREIDTEIKNILDRCYAKCVELLKDNRDKLDKLANALLEKETVDAKMAYEIVGLELPENIKNSSIDTEVEESKTPEENKEAENKDFQDDEKSDIIK